ncbi:MAG: hypothetical protein N2255_09425 [Kiritimatiellae bacterium]|nr:hypothetical protein [Kiritimatiellia bacterium]
MLHKTVRNAVLIGLVLPSIAGFAAEKRGGFAQRFGGGERAGGVKVERRVKRGERKELGANVQERIQERLRQKEQRKEQRQEQKARLQENAQKWVNRRQAIQALRIHHGIRKGYLTDEEIAQLENQQKALAELEAQLLADGKLTPTEFEALRIALKEASRCIWAQKHDTEGEQMPVYVLDKNVFAKDELTQKLTDGTLTGDEARELLGDLRRLLELKKKLATEDLSARDRETLQGEFDELLNKYFLVRG